jgi:hypothetical protein
MDLVDVVVTILECMAIGLGMELGAMIAKVLSVRLLNSASPITPHDVEQEQDDDEEEEEEAAKRRRRRAPRGGGGPSTPTGVRAM